MARMVEPDGAVAACARPFRPPSYAPNRVPDAMMCAGAVITINDSQDGQPRPSLAVSNGASWDRYVRCDEVESLVRKLVTELLKTPPNIDLTPLVRDEVRAIVPALVERVAKPSLPAPTMPQNTPAVAQGLLELAEAVGALQERVDFLETHSLAVAEIKQDAA